MKITTKNIPCQLCGNSESLPLFVAKDRLHGFEGEFSYVKCNQCSLVYMNPQLSDESVALFYPNNYAPHKHEANTQSVLKTKHYPREVRTILTKKPNEQSRLLDVGCGNGKFLFQLKNLIGCSVYGVDVSKLAVKTAKNLYDIEIFEGTVTEAPFENDSFDVITAWSYIEHVNNPLEVLNKLHNLLKLRGDLIIKTPNFNSINRLLFKEKWYHLDCPRHLFLYTPQTISRLLNKTGFIVKKITHETSSKSLLCSLQYYFYDNNYEPKNKNKIKKSFLLKAISSPLTRLNALINMSDIIIITAAKE